MSRQGESKTPEAAVCQLLKGDEPISRELRDLIADELQARRQGWFARHLSHTTLALVVAEQMKAHLKRRKAEVKAAKEPWDPGKELDLYTYPRWGLSGSALRNLITTKRDPELVSTLKAVKRQR